MEKIIAITVRELPEVYGMRDFMEGIMRSADQSQHTTTGCAVSGGEKGIFMFCEDGDGCRPVCVCGETIYAKRSAVLPIIALLCDDAIDHDISENPTIPPQVQMWLGVEKRKKKRMPNSRHGKA